MKIAIGGMVLFAGLLGLVSGTNLGDLFGDGRRLLDIIPTELRLAAHKATDFRILGKLLGENKQPINTVDDINQVVEQVRSLSLKWPKNLPRTIPLVHRRHPVPSESIELIASLPAAIGQCNWAAYKIMLSNYLAALGDEIILKPSDKVKAVTKTAISLHHNQCRPSYYGNFISLWSSLPESLKLEVDKILDPRLIEIVLQSDSRTISSKVYQSNGAWLDKVIELSQQSEDKLGPSETVENYLMRPCANYVRHLGELLYPIVFDLSLQGDAIKEINPEADVRFDDALQKFAICSAITERSGLIVQRIVDSLIGRTRPMTN